MPLVIHPRVRKRFSRLAAMTALGFFASTGIAAAAACPAQPTSRPFRAWGDTNSYRLVPGGSFEGRAATLGWTLDGATLAAGNEPFYVHARTDRQSLMLTGGSTAVSAPFCIDSTMPYFRFFAHPTSAGSGLKVTVLMKGVPGVGPSGVSLTTIPPGNMTAWSPTRLLKLASALSIPAGQSVPAQLKFNVPQKGSWQVDDVYVDPYSFG